MLERCRVLTTAQLSLPKLLTFQTNVGGLPLSHTTAAGAAVRTARAGGAAHPAFAAAVLVVVAGGAVAARRRWLTPKTRGGGVVSGYPIAAQTPPPNIEATWHGARAALEAGAGRIEVPSVSNGGLHGASEFRFVIRR